MSTFPLPREIAEALKSKGALSKSFLDKVYLDTVQDEQQDIAVQQRQAQLAEQQAMAAEASQVQRLAEQAQLQNPGGVQVNGTYGRPTGAVETPLGAAWRNLQTQQTPQAPLPSAPEQVLPESQRLVAEQQSQAALDAAGQAAQQGDTLSAAEMIERGLDLKARAALADSQAAASSGSAQAAQYAALAKGLAGEAEATKARRQQYEQMIDQQMQKNMTKFDEYSSAKIDPNRLYASRTTGQKIMGAIGIALSSFAGKDGAMKAIEKAVQDDINLQKEQINLTGLQLDKGRSLLKDMFDVTKDIDDATNMAQAALIQQAELKIKQIAAQTSSQVAKNNALSILGDLELKKVELLSKVNDPERLEKQATTEALGSGPLELTPQNTARLSTKTIKEGLIPGVGVAVNETARKEVATSRASMEQAISSLKELKAIREKVGVEAGLGLADEKTANRAWLTAFEAVRSSGWGAMDKGAIDTFKNYLPENALTKGLNLPGFMDPAGRVSAAAISSGVVKDPVLSQIDGLIKLFEDKQKMYESDRMIGYTPEKYREVRMRGGYGGGLEKVK